MRRISTFVRAARALLALALVPAATRAQDPFAAGQRWTHPANAASPWLPSEVRFAAAGELVWATGQGVSPRAMALSTAPVLGTGTLAPTRAASLPGSVGTIAVATARDERELFTAAQYATYDASHRRTELAKYDAHDAATLVPRWTRNMGLVGNGVSKLAASRDGAFVVAATHDAQFQVLAIEWIDGASGALLASRAAYAGTLRQMAASADASLAAVLVGGELRLYAPSAGLLFSETLASASQALAITADGSFVAAASGSAVRCWRRTAGVWSFEREFHAGVGEIATRIALSDDGEALAIGWWNPAATHSVRLAAWAVSANALRYERLLDAPASTLQNYVESVCITRDGRRAAFGCWGTADAAPEVVLVDVAGGAEVLSLDLPGSVRCLALDESGTRVAVGAKSVHANLFGSTGELRLYDTGERRAQLVEEPLAGGTLHVAARESGASRIFFYVGTPLAAPRPFPGGGSWWIERSTAQRFTRTTDATGRADLVLSLPASAAGADLAVQTVARTPLGVRVGTNVILPVVF